MFQSLKGVVENTTPPERVVPKFTNVELAISTLVEKLKNVESLTDREITDIIYRQYTTILNYDLFLISPESKTIAQQLFTNERFLNCLVSISRRLHTSFITLF